MPVRLEIIGVFYRRDLPLTGKKTYKIVDVLAAAKQHVGKAGFKDIDSFDYELTAAPHSALTSFTIDYNDEIVGAASGRKYPKGEYFLAENLMGTPAYAVWQYYVLNSDGTKFGSGPKFLDDHDAVVPEGGTLIWRLVTILKGPNPRPNIMQSRQTINVAYSE